MDASQWPTWYSNSVDVQIEDGHDSLAQGVSFRWRTFNFPIESTVDTFTPNGEIGWSVHKVGFDVHHAWVLVPEKGGVRVITEETQKGADAIASGKLNPMPCKMGMTVAFGAQGPRRTHGSFARTRDQWAEEVDDRLHPRIDDHGTFVRDPPTLPGRERPPGFADRMP